LKCGFSASKGAAFNNEIKKIIRAGLLQTFYIIYNVDFLRIDSEVEGEEILL